MNEIFVWNNAFLTQLPEVDDQHRVLIRLINDLGEMIMSSDSIEVSAFLKVRDGVLDYASKHFNDEEALMLNVGVDLRHVRQHIASHGKFVSEAMALGCLSSGNAKQLADYLVQWLAYHILDVDQSMARQIHAIRNGKVPCDAFDLEERSIKAGTEPLLAALRGLFYTVSERNHELRLLNVQLEQRVRERTDELERANTQLREQSTHDDLTGLPNRRYAMLALNRIWLESRRYGDSFSLMMIDADHFKNVNDDFGHPQGDALLCELADRLKSLVRGSDIVCRLGGDEFIVICPRINLEGAMEVGRKILSESHPFLTKDGVECWNGSLSVGVAEMKDEMVCPEDLLKIADLSLYEVKHAGGRTVISVQGYSN